LDRKIRVGAVSYLNTKPLIYGFEKGMMKDEIELVIDYPAKIAAALINDDIDIGLVPVAIIPELKEHYIVSDYCISCDGEVASVCLFSEVPVKEIETVLLDYQSRTSIELAQILLRDYWKIDPVFLKAGIDFRKEIKSSTAAIVIGDRAFEQRKLSKYNYDLGLAWKDMTGLPFVFAAWISNKPINELFIKNFNTANEKGLKNINTIVQENAYTLFDLKQYYTKFIKFRLTAENRIGLNKFITELSLKLVKENPLFK
jgi:chorismate dehydratase